MNIDECGTVRYLEIFKDGDHTCSPVFLGVSEMIIGKVRLADGL